MKGKISIISCGILIFIFAEIANGLEIPPFCVNCTNLPTQFPFLRVETWPVHELNGNADYFTIIVAPKDGHAPGDFSGMLRITDTRGLVVSAPIYSASANKSAVFSFLIGTNYVAKSSFDLTEESFRFEDTPVSYQLMLGTFVKVKR